jgi:hypothetical protein
MKVFAYIALAILFSFVLSGCDMYPPYRVYSQKMEGEYRSATPWQWPCSMTDEELGFWQSVWPEHEFTAGAYIGGRATLSFDGGAIDVDLNSAKYGEEVPDSAE